ncbi:carbohydrate-binding protein [Micromonospora sp. NBC_00617]|uniref:carbohydrate-binding protein n=1 Tax=Micromonospora sp. NBC_00617 TaxID=2903587 RepID=UPI00386C16B1
MARFSAAKFPTLEITRVQFGASFLCLLQFDVDRAEMHIDMYSPFLNNFGATEYDIRQDGSQPKPRYNGSEDNLTLPVDLSTRKTSFGTDSLAAYVPSGTVGTDEVASNDVATATWDKLLPGTPYGWIVSARSADGGEAVAQPAVFATAKQVPTMTVTAATTDWGTAATVTVRVAAGSTPVTGAVELSEGSTVRGSAALTNGAATFTLPVGLAGGQHTLTASYAGDDHLAPVQAAAVLTVNLPAQWSSSTVYNDGDRVTYQGRVFRASWYTKNQKPGADANGAWQEIVMTEDGTAIWTASRIFNAGDFAMYDGRKWRAQWYTRNQKPGDRNGSWRRSPRPTDNSPAAWTLTKVYNAGDRVTFKGHVYEAKWWMRGQEPGDPNGPWKLIK